MTNKLKVFQLLNSSSFVLLPRMEFLENIYIYIYSENKIFLDHSRNIIGERRGGRERLRPRCSFDVPSAKEIVPRAPRVSRCVSKARDVNKRAHPLYLTWQRPQRRETNREERKR